MSEPRIGDAVQFWIDEAGDITPEQADAARAHLDAYGSVWTVVWGPPADLTATGPGCPLTLRQRFVNGVRWRWDDFLDAAWIAKHRVRRAWDVLRGRA